MGCGTSSPTINAISSQPSDMPHKPRPKETVLVALTKLAEQIAASERFYPTQRLTVVSAELSSIQQEIRDFEEITTNVTNSQSYAKSVHQMFISLDLYKRPILATDNEDFIANVNRKELHRLELSWLRTREADLEKERRVLHAQILRIRALYKQTQRLLESIWVDEKRAGLQIEEAMERVQSLRDALALVTARLRASSVYAQAALRLVDDALAAWKFAAIGKSGWERTLACSEACQLLVRARCQERGARRVLATPAAPRAARALRLALDYAFTDTMHDRKYQRATEIFLQFKEALVQLVNSIHQIIRRKSEINIFINGKSVSVPSYYTVLQALRREKVTIPTFCYHERLSIAGNCRMCLVHIEGSPKPQVACAMPISKDMKIRTNSDLTLKAQESVLEFLLLDHPLDCPICDQGGECDLQDLAMKFGNDRSRFTDIHFEGKRAVEDKDIGPLIRTEMTRCIHCTRCIRFASQVCGMDVLGSTGRGGDMLVGTYVDKYFLSELSGNIIDLCPVGALTSKPYMFKSRPWELKQTNSIDVTDATGTNTILNHRSNRILRVLPRENEEINQEWLSDKGRWAIDSLNMQRLVSPMYRSCDCLVPEDWDKALKRTANVMKCVDPSKIMAIAGSQTNVETLVVAKDFLNMLGCENTYIERGFAYSQTGTDIRAGYSFNIKMKNVAKADQILLIGTNPRFEAPILNAWIRQAYIQNECDIFVVGPHCDYNYHVNYIGDDIKCLSDFQKVLKNAKWPLIFVGVDQLGTAEASQIMYRLNVLIATLKVSKDWKIINIVTKEASFAGALECGWKPGALTSMKSNTPSLILSLGADEIFYDWTPKLDTKVIYIGYQGDRGAETASIILPGCAYSESGGTFLNMECRAQFALPAVTSPGMARSDWRILRALAEYCGICLPYSDNNTLCCRLAQISPNLVNYNTYQEKLFTDLILPLIKPETEKPTSPLKVELKTIKDYYCSDVFTCNSPTMVKAQKAAKEFAESSYAAI